MTPKSQLCACSFQDSLWQKNWALEQIREFPDTFGYVWTAENDSNTLRVDAKISYPQKNVCGKKNSESCGHGLRVFSKIFCRLQFLKTVSLTQSKCLIHRGREESRGRHLRHLTNWLWKINHIPVPSRSLPRIQYF